MFGARRVSTRASSILTRESPLDRFATQTCTSEPFLISEERDTVTTDVMGRGYRNDTTTQDGDTRATPTDVKTTFNGVSVKKKEKK